MTRYISLGLAGLLLIATAIAIAASQPHSLYIG